MAATFSACFLQVSFEPIPIAMVASVVKSSTPSTATVRMSDVNSSGVTSILHPDQDEAILAVAIAVSRFMPLLRAVGYL